MPIAVVARPRRRLRGKQMDLDLGGRHAPPAAKRRGRPPAPWTAKPKGRGRHPKRPPKHVRTAPATNTLLRASARTEASIPKARKGFAIFAQEHNHVFVGLVPGGRFKLASSKWKELPNAERAAYDGRSRAEFADKLAREYAAKIPFMRRRGPDAQSIRGPDVLPGETLYRELALVGQAGGPSQPIPYAMNAHTVLDSWSWVCSHEHLLGEGGYGQVFRATNKVTRRLGAVKMFFAADEAERELKTLRQLQPVEHAWHQRGFNPSPRLYEESAQGPCAFYVMEQLQADVLHLMRRDACTKFVIDSVFRQIRL